MDTYDRVNRFSSVLDVSQMNLGSKNYGHALVRSEACPTVSWLCWCPKSVKTSRVKLRGVGGDFCKNNIKY